MGKPKEFPKGARATCLICEATLSPDRLVPWLICNLIAGYGALASASFVTEDYDEELES
jgi:hypothetical protein